MTSPINDPTQSIIQLAKDIQTIKSDPEYHGTAEASIKDAQEQISQLLNNPAVKNNAKLLADLQQVQQDLTQAIKDPGSISMQSTMNVLADMVADAEDSNSLQAIHTEMLNMAKSSKKQ